MVGHEHPDIDEGCAKSIIEIMKNTFGEYLGQQDIKVDEEGTS